MGRGGGRIVGGDKNYGWGRGGGEENYRELKGRRKEEKGGLEEIKGDGGRERLK